MRRFFGILVIILAWLLLAPRIPDGHRGEVGADELGDLNKKIEEYEQKLEELSGQRQTLSATLTYLNTQISLTQSQINKTQAELAILEQEIETLGGRIDQLNTSLDDLSRILFRRVRSTYYLQTDFQPVFLFFSSRGFTDFINRYKYLQAVQSHDKKIMLAMERSRANYDLQKSIKEQKQVEIETLNKTLKSQKANLAQQQQEKAQLLEITKNDEKKFQQLLAQARAELNAIQNIIAGKGEETEVGEVKEGNKIASIIPSASTCSTGLHVHFEVSKNGAHQNPEGYLKPATLSYSYDTSEVQETVNPSGGWRWPVDDPIVITQIYGTTFWTKFLHYDFHTGIDMKRDGDDAAAVFAVSDGTLYRGSVSCLGGTLRYVKVEHSDDLVTYYLHVNYI